jgi:hypothetical protein
MPKKKYRSTTDKTEKNHPPPSFFSSLLGRCAEHLRKAVLHLAKSSGTPQEKLTSMYNSTGFGSIVKSDFPNGTLKDDFESIRGSINVVNIAAMSDDQAYKVIDQICDLSDSVAYALGGQKSAT